MKALPVVGWREWVEFPLWVREPVKAKIDTGALTSALHARKLTTFQRDGQEWARFRLSPNQRSTAGSSTIETRITEWRHVRSSNGKSTKRPVVDAHIRCGTRVWNIELTLVDRSQMGFRMLLGRQALRRRFVVDPSHSFLAGEPVHQPEAKS